MDRRYQVGVFDGCAAIVSPVSLTADCGITLPARRYTYFGKNQPLPMPQGTFHRYRYSTADAKAICDWLNSRQGDSDGEYGLGLIYSSAPLYYYAESTLRHLSQHLFKSPYVTSQCVSTAWPDDLIGSMFTAALPWPDPWMETSKGLIGERGSHRASYTSADWELIETELRGGMRV